MTKRFRMIAGPNGSGKSTLRAWLSRDYAVNFYHFINADDLNEEIARSGLSFSQETVFSHPSKIEALKSAHENGYRTYLYFVATENPRLNVCRVADRVANGGHDVPTEKIFERYVRSLDQVKQAYPYLSRAYFFDNSSDSMRYIAHWNSEDGLVLQTPESRLPDWFSKMR